MAKYKFQGFGTLTIEPTSINVVNVKDRIKEKTADITISLVSGDNTYITTLSGFAYIENWVDEDIEAWVLLKLQDYETN
jgi:hypothetical protein